MRIDRASALPSSTKWLLRGVLLLSALKVAAPATVEAQTNDPAYITANPYLGTPISPYDPRISRYSSDGALNPYTSGGGKIYAQDGTYLGRLNSNRYDPESVSNPYGQYGSRYGANSIKNPYSSYGSRYSSQSATNPYTSTPPIVRYDEDE